MIKIRQLQDKDSVDVQNLWASSMRGSNCGEFQERINRFVECKLNDKSDMGNVFLSYVQSESRGKKEGIKHCTQNETNLHLKCNESNETFRSIRNFWVVEYIEHSGDNSDTEFTHQTKATIVGCIGGIVRSARDLAQIIPDGKEYVNRDEEEYPLWSKPLGVGLSTNLNDGAVELVRMAVDHNFRGKTKKFPHFKEELFLLVLI